MNLVDNLNKNVFRGYDIRGKVPTDIDEDFAYTLGKSYGSFIQDKQYNKCLIAHDNRLSSPTLAKALIQGIIETGVDVVFLGQTTTPMFYYGRILKNIPTGIMVTASHNPKDENGFKFSLDDRGNSCGVEIEEFYKYTEAMKFKKGNGNLISYKIEEEYISLMKQSLNFGTRRIKVIFDPANAASTIILEKILKEYENIIDYKIINAISDGTFPAHHPDPSVEANLAQLKQAVLDEKADLGIAYDGDGDRVGVVDESGNMIKADEFMIIIWRDIVNKVTNKTAVFDVKCSMSLEEELIKIGASPLMYRTGNSYLARKVKEDNISFAGEFSGHMFFNDRFPGFDSGIYASLRLIEILSYNDKKTSQLLENVNKYYASDEIKINSKDENKFIVVEKVKDYSINKGYKISTIDGVRITFDSGWILIRASNTGPDLTIRIEAKTKELLKDIEDEFIPLIKEYNV